MTALHYTLSSQLGELLSENAKTLSVAESCTGGGIAQAITDVPGSSKWFEVGLVTYSNAAKTKLLGVDPHTLAQYGAVSEEVVKGMLTGVLALSGADFALAISGIAGPTGASPGKSVGTVCIAFGDENTACARTYRFLGSRSSVREQSVTSGLQNLLEFCAQRLR